MKKILNGHNCKVLSLGLLDNGDLISGDDDGAIKIWDVEYESVKNEMAVDSKINSIVVLPNGDLVSASDKSIVIWS